MSIKFSGWEVFCEKSRDLKPGQAPKSSRGYTMYHGTHKTNATAIISSGFRPSAGGRLGPGVYCSRNINKAMGYPAFCPPNERVVLKLSVRVGKVKKIDGQAAGMSHTWHQHGYDTAWLPPTAGLEEDCVWDPKRLTVVGIAHCTDPATKTSLETLIKKQQKEPQGGQNTQKSAKCQVCGNQTELNHTIEKCWECKAAICPFMDKHVCHKRG
ncbi:gig2-like protein DreN [Alosa alosa]|uniref:gig2-like protein DreN n=1 Tax=Alosa alosa TaxID=278164 RepID=UPI002015453B|nr:gig2-like protein DreN [Alosa alosa]